MNHTQRHRTKSSPRPIKLGDIVMVNLGKKHQKAAQVVEIRKTRKGGKSIIVSIFPADGESGPPVTKLYNLCDVQRVQSARPSAESVRPIEDPIVREKSALIDELPSDLCFRIGYGLYGQIAQYFIIGVDGTLAQLGQTLPAVSQLRAMVIEADKEHAILVRNHDRNSTK